MDGQGKHKLQAGDEHKPRSAGGDSAGADACDNERGAEEEETGRAEGSGTETAASRIEQPQAASVVECTVDATILEADERLRRVIEQKWKQGILSWKLHSAQKAIYATIRALPSDVRECVIVCSRRFGKSYLGVVCALEDCIRNPGTIVRIVGPEIKQTTQIVVPLINKIIADAPAKFIRRTKSENKWIVGKSELVLGGFDASNIDTHRGSESNSIYIEECGSSDSDDYEYAMKDVLKPQLLHSRGKLTHLTTLPPLLTHSFVLDTIPEAKNNKAFFRFTIYDNPLLDQDQIRDAIRDSGGEESVTFRREYLCEFIKDETVLVVPEFEPTRHVEDVTLPEFAHYITVMDVGGVRDKTVAHLLYYDFARAKRVVYDERVFEPNTPSSDIIDEIRRMEHQVPNVKYRWADMSGQTHVDMNLMHGMPFQMPPKEDWEANINSLKIAMKTDRWVVNSKCHFTIMSLESATFNDTHTDFSRSQTLGHCDAIASLMYANRVIDMSNPVPDPVHNKEYTFFVPRKSDLEIVSESLQPRKFGTFKKPKRW